uniref:Uncharacterized protein n=1 Tax=Rhodnius prolixus TaxID=13249 RepID=T1HTX0_RHOPR
MSVNAYLVVIFVLKGAIQELKIYGRAHLADLNRKPFKEELGKIHMTINVHKSKTMEISRRRDRPLNVNIRNVMLEQVADFKYLGVNINEQCRIQGERVAVAGGRATERTQAKMVWAHDEDGHKPYRQDFVMRLRCRVKEKKAKSLCYLVKNVKMTSEDT